VKSKSLGSMRIFPRLACRRLGSPRKPPHISKSRDLNIELLSYARYATKVLEFYQSFKLHFKRKMKMIWLSTHTHRVKNRVINREIKLYGSGKKRRI